MRKTEEEKLMNQIIKRHCDNTNHNPKKGFNEWHVKKLMEAYAKAKVFEDLKRK